DAGLRTCVSPMSPSAFVASKLRNQSQMNRHQMLISSCIHREHRLDSQQWFWHELHTERSTRELSWLHPEWKCERRQEAVVRATLASQSLLAERDAAFAPRPRSPDSCACRSF